MLYQVFSEKKYADEIGAYTAYGIRAVDNGEALFIIRDVTLNRDHIAALAAVCNAEQPSFDHLTQIIEDYLYDFEV